MRNVGVTRGRQFTGGSFARTRCLSLAEIMVQGPPLSLLHDDLLLVISFLLPGMESLSVLSMLLEFPAVVRRLAL